ncbi:MAG: hypothetical protein SPF89_11645 [Sphaerochaetaceae bacterium]|nr:hypothetical protein [Spirochaetales bacterium]MDY5500749.1 hypothetical protein [Sphaerochaetaceae bacterium]
MYQAIRPYQPHLCDVLEGDMRSGKFPQAVLFGGPRYSLKMTTALETVRILSCQKEGADDCQCPSCRASRLLEDNNLLVLSQRDQASILRTSVGVYRRLRTLTSREQLVRATRIALLYYHGALLKTAASSQKAAFAAAGALNDLLLTLRNADEDDEKGALKFEKEYLDALKKLELVERKDTTLSIDQVRAIDDWTHQTTVGGKRQFVILEGVEEANVSARNSLLKILEEPPKDVYFILISTHPERLLATILSRVRKYRFSPLEGDSVKRLLASSYPDKPYTSFEEFFLAGSGSDSTALKDWAGRLAMVSLQGGSLESGEVAQLAGECTSQSALEFFLQSLLEIFERDFLDGRIPLAKARRLSSLVSSLESAAVLYNQDRRLLIQNLCLKLWEEGKV